MSSFKKLSAYADAPCEWVSAAALHNNKIDQLEAENAKLRELVHDFYVCLDTILGLAGYKGFVILPYQELFDSLPVRMRELGVEVDDG